jgi:O-antigen ligase
VPLVALAVWPLVAFGGRSAAIAAGVGCSSIVYALLVRPRIGAGVDRALGAVLAIMALQLVPLPVAVLSLLSPHAFELRQEVAISPAPASAIPISIDPWSTAWAWIVVAGAVAIFWTARTQFRRGGVRRTIRGIAAIGFVMSLLAIAQAATAGRNIYWLYPTEFEGPLPFGPFVNRNHFATWAIMALPLFMGYIAARTGRRHEDDLHIAMRSKLADAMDARTMWLTASCTAMAIALLLTLSRSGALALSASAIATTLACRHRLDRRRRRTVLLAAAIVFVLGSWWADIPALKDRFAGTPSGLAHRVAIWRETLPVVRDFWFTGTGAGTYQRAMLVYQRSDRGIYFNQAHNHYLQILVEGGVLLALAVAIALLVFARAAQQRIAGDATGLVWIRIGALCGLGAVALQSVWETGLVMPANAMLAAILAAVVVYERRAAAVSLEN